MNTLQTRYPYLSNFFETAINNDRLFHSIILYGSNSFIKYALALELARKLNCLENGNSECNCQNCRWIRENKHPAIMTISKIDNKTDKSKTVISEEQTNMVIETINNPSNYHKVFIFCNADIKIPTELEKEQYQEFLSIGFNPTQIDETGKIWYPSGINTKCWSKEAANQLLKSIEEPANNITFFFLTDNQNDLLATIVSRSQLFYVPDVRKTNYSIEFLPDYFVNYPHFNSELEFSSKLLEYQNKNNVTPDFILDCIQDYLVNFLKTNNFNKLLFNKVLKDINEIETAKKMLKSYVKEQNVYEYLAFYFSRRQM